jgi:iron complex outermembrane receptor protein
LTHQTRESLINSWVNLRHENRWSSAFGSELDLGYARGEPTRNDRLFVTGTPGQSYSRNFRYQAFNSSAALNVTPIPALTARVGVEASLELHDILFYTVTFAAAQGMREAGERAELIPNGVNKEETVSNRGGYLLVTAHPIPSFRTLSVTGVVRLDRTAYGDVDLPTMFSARAFAVAGWTPWLVTKVGVSRGFLAPSAVLMFAQSGFGLSNNLIGNRAPTSGAPEIEPARLDSVEAAVSVGFWKAAFLELAFFRQKIENRFEFVQTGLDFVARNTGAQTVLGGEATLRTSLGPVNPFVAGALVDPEDETLVAYPRFVGTFGMELALFDRPALFFDGRIRHVSSRDATGPHTTLNGRRSYSLPSYRTVDLSLSLSELALLGGGAQTEFVASARNVTDERHSEPGYAGFDVPALGRTALFEVRQSF